jgi:hypothetical protein
LRGGGGDVLAGVVVEVAQVAQFWGFSFAKN